MSLANIQGKLSRAEMKNIMAGSGGSCPVGTRCTLPSGLPGKCYPAGYDCLCIDSNYNGYESGSCGGIWT